MRHFIAALLMAVTLPAIARADVSQPAPQPNADPYFAAPGHWEASLATGVPYVAIGEGAYGVSQHFTLGVVGGLTPSTWGAGLRAHVLLFDDGPQRIYATLPALYYPATQKLGGQQWVLSMPSAFVEQRLGTRWRAHAGLGVAAAAAFGPKSPEASSPASPNADDWGVPATSTAAPSASPTTGLWETATLGASFSATSRTAVFADVSGVFHGIAPAQDWIAGFPMVLFVGASYAI